MQIQPYNHVRPAFWGQFVNESLPHELKCEDSESTLLQSTLHSKKVIERGHFRKSNGKKKRGGHSLMWFFWSTFISFFHKTFVRLLSRGSSIRNYWFFSNFIRSKHMKSFLLFFVLTYVIYKYVKMCTRKKLLAFCLDLVE